MSRQQLLQLLRQAETDPGLRRQLRLCTDWSRWLQQARARGFDIGVEDLSAARASEQTAAFMTRAQLAPIRRLS